jgi:hypothetical protein
MGELIAYGSKVTSIFQLIGTLENDITKSIAWALCQCPYFSKCVFDECPLEAQGRLHSTGSFPKQASHTSYRRRTCVLRKLKMFAGLASAETYVRIIN